MKKNIGRLAVVMLPLLLLTACGPIGEKQTSMAVIYGVLAALSLLLLLCYCLVIKKFKIPYFFPLSKRVKFILDKLRKL